MSVLLGAIQQHPNLKSRIQEIVLRADYSEPEKMAAIQRVVREKFTLPRPLPAMNAVAGWNHEEEVAVVGERTFAQRDAECRKRAVDLEAETPRKRGRGAAAALEERVVSARSVCTAAVDKRVRELAQPALDEYMADRIDAAELDRRKAEAREKATAEHAPLTELERASAEYTEAVSARTKAEAAEDAAEAKLEAVLRGLERGQPGPSGVKA